MSGTPKDERRGLIDGRYVIAMLFLTVVVLPAIVWGTLQWVRTELAIEQPPLSWAQRADWPSPPISRTSLERPASTMGYSHDKGKWEDLAFQVSTREEQVIKRCAAIAGTVPDAHATGDGQVPTFSSAAARDELESFVQQHPQMFYPRYLLGTWHRLFGDAEAAAPHYEQAFAHAPAVVKQRYVDPADEPLGSFYVGTWELACDRVIDGELDQTLKLLYPELETDASGWVYLPVYDTVYRATKLPEPPGYRVRYQISGWFRFPGRLGTLKRAVVLEDERGTASR